MVNDKQPPIPLAEMLTQSRGPDHHRFRFDLDGADIASPATRERLARRGAR